MITDAAESFFEKTAPALSAAAGTIVRVKNAAELRDAIHNAADDSTIMIADGTYEVERPLYLRKGRNITIRGESGDPKKVKLRGKGFEVGNPGDDILRLANVENATVAHLTFEECRSYGVKVEAENFPKNVHIYDCRFKNIGIRAIKGSTSTEGKAAGGSIRFCRFENTKIPPAEWLAEGNYITAIDMMALEDWVVSDNVFKGMLGRSGQARGAVFIWVRSKRVTVERNFIYNCNRGVSFGNPSGSSAFVEGQDHVADSIIRNNVIVTSPDAGIELWWVKNTKVYNNSISGMNGDIAHAGMRGGFNPWRLENVELKNNLVHGRVELAEGVTLTNNLIGEFFGYFKDVKRGDLRLSNKAKEARSNALVLPEVTDDFSGQKRSETPSIGACE